MDGCNKLERLYYQFQPICCSAFILQTWEEEKLLTEKVIKAQTEDLMF